MKVCVLEKKDNTIRILIENAPLSLVNAIRRAAMAEVPVMAVDYVEVFENNTVLYDEIIAHRLAMIPLTSERALEKYKRPEECSESSVQDTSCYTLLRLEVETQQGQEMMVYSKDLEASDPDVRPVHDDIPIALLASEQRLHLHAYARLGYGKEHAKWMPVTVAAHRYLPVVKYDLERASEECRRCLMDTAPQLFEKMLSGRKGVLEIYDDINTSGIYWCATKKCEGAVEVHYDESRIILKFEGTGALPIERVVKEAAQAISRKAEYIISQLAKVGQSLGG
ncbi:MAG: DNA-directed RNA polymerase subunit D [Thermoproteota archaeon]